MKTVIQKDNGYNLGTIILRCDDKCCMLVVDKYKWGSLKEIDYNISIQDSNLTGYNTFLQRIKLAVKVLLGKPVHYNDLYIEDENKIVEFRDALTELINK